MTFSILRLPSRVRHAFHDPGSLFDLCRGTLLAVIGLWFLHPFWAQLRFPGIAREMESLAHISVWGMVCVTVGAVMMGAVIGRWLTILILCYFISFAIWVCIFLLFIQRAAPPPEGYFALVIAVFSLFRIVRVGADQHYANHADHAGHADAPDRSRTDRDHNGDRDSGQGASSAQ